jgi:protein-S-isoprenylcysteine O-methyltransferase Ste14
VTATSQPNGSAPTVVPGRHAAEPTVGQLVSDASTHFSTLLHSEIELAKLEVKSSVKNAGTGIGFFGAAVVLLVFSLTFGLIALAEGLITIGLWRWLSYLIVFGALLLTVGLLVYMGVRKVKRVRVPERTIATSKDTVAYLKANTKRG